MRYEHSMGQGLPDFIHRMAAAKSSPMEPAAPLRAAAR